MNHSNLNQGFTIAGHAFIIFGMSTVIDPPGKRPFDDPTPGQHGKPGALFFDDFQINFVRLFQGRDPVFEDVTSIAAIDPQLFESLNPGGKISAQDAHCGSVKSVGYLSCVLIGYLSL